MHVSSVTFITHPTADSIFTGNQAAECKLGLFQHDDFAGNLRLKIDISWRSVVFWNPYDLCRYRGLVRNTQLYPTAALKVE